MFTNSFVTGLNGTNEHTWSGDGRLTRKFCWLYSTTGTAAAVLYWTMDLKGGLLFWNILLESERSSENEWPGELCLSFS